MLKIKKLKITLNHCQKLKQPQQMFPQQTSKVMTPLNKKIIIGAYPYRGNVHICRLLCEYLEVPYENMSFNPYTWKMFRQKNTTNWLFEQLPFLHDKQTDIIITLPMPMCNYIAKKAGKYSLFGKTVDDILIVDKFLWGKDMIQHALSLIVEHKNNPSKLTEQMKKTWEIYRKQLLEYQSQAKTRNSLRNQQDQQDQQQYKFEEVGFYLGYLTLIDFIIHEIFMYFRDILKHELQHFPTLFAIRNRFAELPVIKCYQSSDRTVRNMCPLQFYRKWKLDAMKS